VDVGFRGEEISKEEMASGSAVSIYSDFEDQLPGCRECTFYFTSLLFFVSYLWFNSLVTVTITFTVYGVASAECGCGRFLAQDLLEIANCFRFG